MFGDRQTHTHTYTYIQQPTALTVESNDAGVLILVILVHLAAGHQLEGEGREDGQRVQAGQEVEGDVEAAGGGLLGARETDGGAEDGVRGI